MPTKAIVQTTFTGNDAPFIAAVERAEKRAQTFSSKVEHLFKRDPGRRAETAISGLVSNLAAGNVQGAITSITERIGGLGLALGVGLGAGVAIFEKLHAQIEATEKATDALNKELSKPLSLQSALGPEGISAQLEATEKAFKDVEDKRKTIGSRIGEWFQSHFAPGGGSWGQFTADPISTKSSRAEAEGFERIKRLTSARADAELKVVNIRRLGLQDSEREGELAKVKYDADRKRAALFIERGLTRPGRDQLSLFKGFAAINQDERISADQAKKKSDAKREEEAIQNSILNLQVSGLTKDEQALQVLKERINLLKGQLNDPRYNAEEKTGIGTKIHELENQQLIQRYQNRFDGPALWTPEKGAARDFQNYVRTLSPTNPNAYITHPDAYARSPDAYNGPDDTWSANGKPTTANGSSGGGKSGGPLTKEDLDAVMGKYWEG